MLLDRLCQIEELTRLKIKEEKEKLNTVKILKSLLKKVDLKSELMPDENKQQLTKLLQHLKGKDLDYNEMAIVEEIV